MKITLRGIFYSINVLCLLAFTPTVRARGETFEGIVVKMCVH